MDANELKSMFTHSPKIALSGKGRINRSGTSYTDRELYVARFIARLAFVGASMEHTEPLVDEEMQKGADIVDTFKTTSAMSNGFKDVAHAIRATYRMYEELQHAVDETRIDWPKCDSVGARKPRDESSVRVLFRKAIKGLVPNEIRDQVFKPLS